MSRLSVPIVASALALLVSLPVVRAADPDTVYAAGVSEIREFPQFLRLQIDVIAAGKDLADAMQKLKAQQKIVTGKLKEWDPQGKGKITFSEPGLSSIKTEQQQQFEAMIMMRIKGGKKPVKTPAQVVVGANLRADLPLPGANAEQILAAAQDRQAEIRKADFSNVKALEKGLGPVDPELAEELQGYIGPRRGEPSFLFVAPITKAQRDEALTAALKKARDEAAAFARIAGMELGGVHNLSAEYSEPDDGVMDPQRMRDRNAGVPVEWSGEAVTAQPGPATIRFLVKVHFHLKPGK